MCPSQVHIHVYMHQLVLHNSQWAESSPETVVGVWLVEGVAVGVSPLATAAVQGPTTAGKGGGCSELFHWMVGGAAAGLAYSVLWEGQHFGQVVAVGGAAEWAESSGQGGM